MKDDNTLDKNSAELNNEVKEEIKENEKDYSEENLDSLSLDAVKKKKDTAKSKKKIIEEIEAIKKKKAENEAKIMLGIDSYFSVFANEEKEKETTKDLKEELVDESVNPLIEAESISKKSQRGNAENEISKTISQIKKDRQERINNELTVDYNKEFSYDHDVKDSIDSAHEIREKQRVTRKEHNASDVIIEDSSEKDNYCEPSNNPNKSDVQTNRYNNNNNSEINRNTQNSHNKIHSKQNNAVVIKSKSAALQVDQKETPTRIKTKTKYKIVDKKKREIPEKNKISKSYLIRKKKLKDKQRQKKQQQSRQSEKKQTNKNDKKDNKRQNNHKEKGKLKKASNPILRNAKKPISIGNKGIKTFNDSSQVTNSQEAIDQATQPAKKTVKAVAKVSFNTGKKIITTVLKNIIKGLIKILGKIAAVLGPVGIAVVVISLILTVGINSVFISIRPSLALQDVLDENMSIEELLQDEDFRFIRTLAENHKKQIQELEKNISHNSLILPTGYGIPELDKLYFYAMYDGTTDFQTALARIYEESVRIETSTTSSEENFKTLTIKTEVDLPDMDVAMIPLYEENINEYKEIIYKVAGIKPESNRPVLAGSVEATVWFFLLENGFTKEAIAGIMGNLYAESGFNISAIEQTASNPGEGIGLVQWSFGRKAELISFAEKQNKQWNDLTVQLEFLLYEMNHSQAYRFNVLNLPYPAPYNVHGLDGGINEFKNLKDIKKATQVFCWNFETPMFSLYHYSVRETKAFEYYNQFKDYDSRADYSGSFGDEDFAALIAEAEKHLGKPYVFGANGPNAFDCSSFVCWSFTHSGVLNMPRTTAQAIYVNYCTPISAAEARAGDLVFFTRTYPTSDPITHIGIYVGDNKMIHAGSPIEYTDLSYQYYQDHFYTFGRVRK